MSIIVFCNKKNAECAQFYQMVWCQIS